MTQTQPRVEVTLSQLIATLSQLGIDIVVDAQSSERSDAQPSTGPSSVPANLAGAADAPTPQPTQDQSCVPPKYVGDQDPPPFSQSIWRGSPTKRAPAHGGTSQNQTPSSSVRASSKKPWYVVTRGLDVGVFQGWPVVSPLVTGVSGACYEKYPMESEARTAFEEALRRGSVQTV